ncbi:serine/threonine-protein kinase [Bacillus sp. FJAT-45066]|uniref:serine/threonine-protein kinase n=1 Tax=Bacillus sp. FJAT-45066 TaxID=2011010 RepID=UPI000BB8E230|nr:serine/threonine-protein kinase [Bacillus sp. FJAT-45066]
MSTFKEQHPNYKYYENKEYQYMDSIPLFGFFPELSGFINKELQRQNDPEEVGYAARRLQNLLATEAGSTLVEYIPYTDMLDEIIKVFRKLNDQGFSSFMDGMGILAGEIGTDRVNEFLESQEIGYWLELFMGKIDWYYQDDTEDQSKLHLFFELEYVKIRGAGHFCEVHKYKHSTTGEKFALKRLKKKHIDNSAYKSRFKREIEMLEKLKGTPNIVPILDWEFDEKEELYYYIMPFIDQNLHDYIVKHNGKILLEERLLIFTQVLSAINQAHALKIIHRDLHPHNILLKGNQVMVSDFGLGKDFAVMNTHYSSVEYYGAFLYAAPEQMDKLGQATELSDIYSLGKLLYFTLTGKKPRNTYTEAKGFEQLIIKATQDNPEERYKDINEFTAEYEKIIVEISVR